MRLKVLKVILCNRFMWLMYKIFLHVTVIKEMSGDILYDKSIFVQLKIDTFQIWLHKEVFMVFPHLSLVLWFFISCGLRTRKFCRVCIQIIANTCFQNCCYESITMLWMCFFHDRKHYCCTGPWLSQLLREIFCWKIFLFQMQGLGSELYISQQNRCICVFCWTNVSPLLKQWVRTYTKYWFLKSLYFWNFSQNPKRSMSYTPFNSFCSNVTITNLGHHRYW